MDRIKTFVPSGVAPNGRLYAGDVNLLQDLVAALSDFDQTVDVSILRVGDSGLQIVKYGSGEFRLTGAVRTDGILRGLGGIVPGAFTTAQRNAIASGLAPFGMAILNSDTGKWEYNAGTDGARNWQPFVPTPSGVPAGVIHAYAGSSLPTGHLWCDGTAVSRSTYAALFSAIGTTYGPGNGSTTFNVPDLRGRVPVGLGTHADVNALGDNDGITLANRSPRHNSTNSLTLPNHIHSHTLTLPDHIHSAVLIVATSGSGGGYDYFDSSGAISTTHAAVTVGNPTMHPSITGAIGNPTTNPAITGTIGPGGSLPIDMPAYLVCNYIIVTG